MLTLTSFLQDAKAFVPMFATFVGIATVGNATQPKNALSSIVVTLVPMLALVMAMQASNAFVPMLMTLSGMLTPESWRLSKNALLPIPVTGNPAIVPGMSTKPPEPP